MRISRATPNASTSRVSSLLVLIVLVAGAAQAQGLGYGIAGPAGTSGFVNTNTTFHAAGGGELVAADRVGVGGEFGFFNRLIVGTANATLHLGALSVEKTTAFVTGGYSRMGIGDGEGAFSAINFGGGVHFWPGSRGGVRVEFRDHLRRDDRGNTHYWSIRAGVVFR